MIVEGDSVLDWRRTSIPSMAGRPTSSNAKWGCWSARVFRASSPLLARSTSKPSPSRARPIVRSVSASSSTIRMEYAMLNDDLLADRLPPARLMNGQHDTYGCSHPGIAVKVDISSMTLDVVASEDVLGDAGSSVTHAQLDHFSESLLFGEDRDRSSGGRRLGGVEQQVHQDLRDLVGVGGDYGQVVRHAVLQLKSAEQRLVLDKMESVADQLRQVDLAERERAGAGIGHESVDSRGAKACAFDALLDLCAAFARGVFPVQLEVRENP